MVGDGFGGCAGYKRVEIVTRPDQVGFIGSQIHITGDDAADFVGFRIGPAQLGKADPNVYIVGWHGRRCTAGDFNNTPQKNTFEQGIC